MNKKILPWAVSILEALIIVFMFFFARAQKDEAIRQKSVAQSAQQQADLQKVAANRLREQVELEMDQMRRQLKDCQ